ncbi:MAG TPA: hemerythrin domain-containing protein [Pirellulales bacterium]
MLTAQGTLTVNAAFLQEIKDENRELRQLLHDCDAALGKCTAAAADSASADGPLDPKLALDLLMRLRNQLSLHFSLEETYGYFDDAVQVTPQLADRALKLRGQHSELFLSFCGLVDHAEQATNDGRTDALPDVARQFTDFHARFQEHESLETELIVQVLNEEIGCGD